MPSPASPMDTYTGFERPGTVTLRTRIEYAGEGDWTDDQAVEAETVRRKGPGDQEGTGVYIDLDTVARLANQR